MAEGTVNIEGGIKLTLNPPKADVEGVQFDGTWVRAELEDDGKFTVTLFGGAVYDGPEGRARTLSYSTVLDDPGLEPIKGALAQVLEAYTGKIKADTMSAGAEARSFAHRRDGGK